MRVRSLIFCEFKLYLQMLVGMFAIAGFIGHEEDGFL